MRLDFMCPGMAKCGTTTLHCILKQHPNICLPSTMKEPRWLSNYDLCTSRDINWYAEYYYGISEKNPQKDDILYGEINPSFYTTSAKRLHDFFGEFKIIFLFRNPVERFWSQFNMWFRRNIVMESESVNGVNGFAACESQAQAFSMFCNTNFERIGNRIKYAGMYNPVIAISSCSFLCKTYLKFFRRENIKAILFEDFVRDPEEVCKELFSFLGVKEDAMIDYSIKANIGSYNVITKEERNLLADIERKKNRVIWQNGSSEELKMVLEERSLIDKQIKAKAQNRGVERPSQECIEMLQEYFSDEKKYVEEYLQRDLSDLWF